MKTIGFALVALSLLACGGAHPPAATALDEASDPPMPSGHGTKRALVLVDGDTAPSPASKTPPSDALSTRKIVQKVLNDGR